MDGSRLSGKQYRGYAKVAQKIGFDYSVYRANSASNPIRNATKVATLKVSLNQKGDYKKPDEYGSATWWSYHDGRETQVGDYLVGRMGTFFIAAQQDILPILCVMCDRTVSIIRPTNPDGKGAVGYGGQVEENDTALMTSWPASVLMNRDDKNPLNLPLDTKNPSWKILLPYYEGVVLRTSDQITDDLDRRYGIQAAELTDLGWRITAAQLQA